jgi:hypothetical protein
MSNRNLFLAVPPHDLSNVANYNINFCSFYPYILMHCITGYVNYKIL